MFYISPETREHVEAERRKGQAMAQMARQQIIKHVARIEHLTRVIDNIRRMDAITDRYLAGEIDDAQAVRLSEPILTEAVQLHAEHEATGHGF